MNHEKKQALINRIRPAILEYANFDKPTDEALKAHISEIVFAEAERQYLTITEKNEIIELIYCSIRGMGLLDEIIADESITEVMINGADTVFVEKKGELIKLDKTFENTEKLLDIVNRIVRTSNREVNNANPIVDTRLSDGSRVNVVLPPIALNGPIVTIRRFSKEPMTFEKLIKYGSVTPQIRDLLRELVEAKYNIFISGGTGSGKTTFLNALSNFIPKDERVITIEDSAELQIENVPNLVRLETRNANSANTGAITIRDLIKSSLRMRPERIVVGEVRGAEALDMLQAMNTGHDGSLSTGHANSAQDMLSRLETMVLSGAEGLPLQAIRQQICSALDIIIHLSRMRDKTRKTVEISEVVDIDENGRIRLNKLFEFKETEGSTLTKVKGKLVRTENELINKDKLINRGKDPDIFNEKHFV